MIGFGELAIVLAVLGVVMLIGSIAKTSYAGSLRSVGELFLVVGIILYVVLLLVGS